MKRQIRRGTFETNSSSTHAICITKSEYRHNSFSHIDFEIGEFGWENDEYDSLYNKASYLITAILSFDKDEADENLQKLKDILDSNNIEYTLPELKVKSWKYGGKTRYYYDIDGYIDHSCETKDFVNDVLSDSDKLFRYLFGNSVIITGNDNSENYKTLMNELSMTENMIAEYRSNYNKQIKEYKRYVRKFPTRQFLGLLGYEVQEYEYLDYNAPVDAPQSLFKED